MAGFERRPFLHLLLANAIKFTQRKGEIKIKTIQSEDNIQFEISDNGVGISSTQKEILFEVDRKKSTPGTENEEGTGLGLALCKEFVLTNHGKIWADSSQGASSSFYIQLPRP